MFEFGPGLDTPGQPGTRPERFWGDQSQTLRPEQFFGAINLNPFGQNGIVRRDNPPIRSARVPHAVRCIEGRAVLSAVYESARTAARSLPLQPACPYKPAPRAAAGRADFRRICLAATIPCKP